MPVWKLDIVKLYVTSELFSQKAGPVNDYTSWCILPCMNARTIMATRGSSQDPVFVWYLSLEYSEFHLYHPVFVEAYAIWRSSYANTCRQSRSEGYLYMFRITSNALHEFLVNLLRNYKQTPIWFCPSRDCVLRLQSLPYRRNPRRFSGPPAPADLNYWNSGQDMMSCLSKHLTPKPVRSRQSMISLQSMSSRDLFQQLTSDVPPSYSLLVLQL
jgi:hypothetical protein